MTDESGDKYAEMFQDITGQSGTTEPQEETEVVDVSEAEERGLPTTEAYCDDCGNDRAYYYTQQIRAADESETRFFVCTECEKRWREDDN
ncbi:transcription factor TFIIS [Halobacteriales archaeon SW_7_68_16]|nr:MAG: transcription factor TFIIS [Halobacteriales archaeon SW_7_68_16]